MAEVPQSVGEVTEENKQKAEDIKEQANSHFKKQNYAQAIELYTEAINLNPAVAAYYGNRSFAYLKTECFGYALSDATKALELDKTYIKAYYRRASANMALGKFKLALKDFGSVVKVRPTDKDAKAKYTECNKIVKRLAFERAIAVDDNALSVAVQINLDQMSIEEEYSGPKFEDGTLTLQFIKELMECYKKQGKLHRRYAYQILLDVVKLFKEQSSLVDITILDDSKFTVCGDIHGQFYDLMNIFDMNGLPSEENPYIHILAGNHESSTMNQMYGFEGEVKAKYTSQMANLFTEVFNYLPLAHLINDKVLIMHGGLFSEDGVTLDDIRKVDRNRQPPDSGIMCELLWSDPQPHPGCSPSKRGVGTQFGPDVTKSFLQKNGLQYIIRSHEVKNEGYELAHDGLCITVFSAPNYCDTMGNKGAFITLKGGDLKPKFTSYSAVPHPNVKPMAYANSLLSLLA
ncbi:hypothetical protein LSH36_31g05027 [Paralvinella palmiformis]|uniref:protein-serine/threonine phosphatase n=1 Tax=Paralvinella palmiformis TaxID=53620 RepID=A0AAD9NEE7_9ANNE|nr:hypothetical protein LSH36_31g05027 [Paralvinella palmiformis]